MTEFAVDDDTNAPELPQKDTRDATLPPYRQDLIG